MVQKSHSQRPGMVLKPGKWNKLPTSTGDHRILVHHQQWEGFRVLKALGYFQLVIICLGICSKTKYQARYCPL